MVSHSSNSVRSAAARSQTHSPFRVVPPQPSGAQSGTSLTPQTLTPQILSSPEKPADQTANQAIEQAAQKSPDVPATVAPHRRLLTWTAILAGIGAIGLIPTPYQVGGDVQLAWKEDARQALHTPMPAIVDQVLVQPGDSVQPGQPLIQLTSRDLTREIADVQNQLVQAQQTLQSAQQAHVQAEAALLTARAQEQAVQERTAPLLQRMERLEQGILTPEMQQLQVERQRLQGRLSEIQTTIERFEELAADGAIAAIKVEEQHTLYRDVQKDLAVNEERMAQAQQELRDRTIHEVSTLSSQNAAVVAAQIVADSAAQLTAQQQTIQVLETRLATLSDQQTQLVLTAKTAGTVITSDLDLLVGQEVKPDEALLQIADLTQLTANVEIKEEDLDFVEMGAEVTFRPRQAKLDPYDARVDDILYNVEADETQQKRVATVRVVIDNPEERLRPGSSGYAKIFSEWMPLYQRVGREVLKLIPERFL